MDVFVAPGNVSDCSVHSERVQHQSDKYGLKQRQSAQTKGMAVPRFMRICLTKAFKRISHKVTSVLQKDVLSHRTISMTNPQIAISVPTINGSHLDTMTHDLVAKYIAAVLKATRTAHMPLSVIQKKQHERYCFGNSIKLNMKFNAKRTIRLNI